MGPTIISGEITAAIGIAKTLFDYTHLGLKCAYNRHWIKINKCDICALWCPCTVFSALGHLLQKNLKLWKSTSDVDNIVIDIEEEIEVPEFDDMIFLEAKKLNDSIDDEQDDDCFDEDIHLTNRHCIITAEIL